ncbi:MAG: glycosyltransferase family 4 protein [Chitinophagaceae bacterium]|nr:glycosyltransferase family 4 protein [Chitinophagaceae bacterium]
MIQAKQRILALVPYPVFPAVMGGQKGIALFYAYLSKLVELTCITTKNNHPEESFEVLPVISNSVWRYVNPWLFIKINRLLTQKQCTHFLAEHPYFAWLIWLIKRQGKVQVIVHSHNIESERFRSIGKSWWKILWYYERWAYKNADILWFKTPEDKAYAIEQYGISSSKCVVIPYGIEVDQLPVASEINEASSTLREQYKLSKDNLLLLFNGTLSYGPNLDALKAILENINPILMNKGIEYTIFICGRHLPAEMSDLKAYADKHIIYCGFVEDIDLYFKGCDIFLNPLFDGGGIKTKLVEALGFGKKCVSSVNGGIGVNKNCTSGRLRVVEDKNWMAYVDEIIDLHQTLIDNDHQEFYTHFAWKNIAAKAQQSLA